MKHISIIIIISALCITSKAQSLKHDVDSLINNKYDYSSIYYFKNKRLSVQEEQDVLNQLIKHKYSSSYESRMTVSNLLYSIALYGDNINIRQEAAFHETDMYWISYHFKGHNLYPKEVYTKKTINRITEIINGINNKEINIRINDEVHRRIKYKTYQNKIKKLAAKTNLDFHICEDSVSRIIYENIKTSIKKDLSDTKCKYQFIKTLGWLYHKDAETVLKKLLANNFFTSREHTDAIKYALARMGNKYYTKQILNRDYFDFRYLNTQESYWKYIEQNYIFDEYIKCVSDNTEDIWPASNSAELTLFIMTECIQNLPVEYRVELECSTDEHTIDEMKKRTKKALIWLKKNKGKYVINDYKYIN